MSILIAHCDLIIEIFSLSNLIDRHQYFCEISSIYKESLDLFQNFCIYTNVRIL